MLYQATTKPQLQRITSPTHHTLRRTHPHYTLASPALLANSCIAPPVPTEDAQTPTPLGVAPGADALLAPSDTTIRLGMQCHEG